MSDALTDVRFWMQVLTDARRTVLCSPENESRCKGYVDARGLAGQFTVIASPIVSDDHLIIVDEQALEATTNKAALGAGRFRYTDLVSSPVLRPFRFPPIC